MIDINDYKLIYNLKIKSLTRVWLSILIFIIIGIFFINKSFKYQKYYINIGEYKDEKINIYVLIDDINKITNNKNLIIDDEKFAYEIENISEDNIYLNDNYYKEVKISIDKKRKENEIVKIKIITEEITILEYIFETVWR